ncbi:hypothetical protein FRC0043_00514 [Corynebacterium belfantii]|nr:hypothetical protein FRC0043_00514 [Corynebacterium belfantii]STC67410.1 Uncharacterised protein [Corynebacterium diphtheriae]
MDKTCRVFTLALASSFPYLHSDRVRKRRQRQPEQQRQHGRHHTTYAKELS